MRKYLIHIACWAAFIAYEVAIAFYMGSRESLWVFAGFYALNIGFFYFNALVVFDRALGDNGNMLRYVLLVLFILAELGVYTGLSLIMDFVFERLKGQARDSFTEENMVRSIWRGIYFLGLSTGYWFVLSTMRAVRREQQARIKELEAAQEKSRLEKKNFQLQNAYLQARINPHFLFNTLNFIYNEIEEVAPPAAGNLMLLSDIMRYSLDDVDGEGKVPLSGEISQVKKYILLNRSRFGEAMYLHVAIDPVAEHTCGKIPPLLLLTFIENVFKHGDMRDPAMPGMISICCRGGWLHLHTKNKKKKRVNGYGTHIGMQNAAIRIQNYYPEGDWELSVDEPAEEGSSGCCFILNLKLKT